MRILLTHERFLPDFRGGGEILVYETAKNLLRKGVRVQVLTTGQPKIGDYEGVPTKRLPIHPYRFNLAVRAIAELARQSDLVHTFNYHAALPSLIAGKSVGTPVVCSILGFFQAAWKDMKGPVLGPAFEVWERFLVTRNYSRTIFPSESSRKLGVALGVDEDKAIVNSPGIDVAFYTPAAQKEDVVLFAGKFDVRKGIGDVLGAARKLPQVRFQLLGWGPIARDIREAQLPNVELIPFCKGEKLRDIFARARIFLLPSRAEPFGIVLLEAMASGCAIVSSVPLEFSGERFPPGDLQRLVKAVERLWHDRPATERMGQENVKRAQKFTWDQHISSLLSMYQAVLQEKR